MQLKVTKRKFIPIFENKFLKYFFKPTFSHKNVEIFKNKKICE